MTTTRRYAQEFEEAVGRCISSLGNPKKRKLMTGIEAFDSITGGLTTADLTVLNGPSGSGKSCLLRQMALSAAKSTHVLYVPLQDGAIENAVKRLVSLVAEVPLSDLDEHVPSEIRIRAIEAGDVLKNLDLSLYSIDGMTFQMLLEIVAEDFTGDPDADPIDGDGLVLIDGATMLEDGYDFRSLIRALKSLAYGSGIAVVASIAGDSDALADAGSIINLERREDSDGSMHEISVTVGKDNWGSSAGRHATMLMDKKTLHVRTWH